MSAERKPKFAVERDEYLSRCAGSNYAYTSHIASIIADRLIELGLVVGGDNSHFEVMAVIETGIGTTR